MPLSEAKPRHAAAASEFSRLLCATDDSNYVCVAIVRQRDQMHQPAAIAVGLGRAERALGLLSFIVVCSIAGLWSGLGRHPLITRRRFAPRGGTVLHALAYGGAAGSGLHAACQHDEMRHGRWTRVRGPKLPPGRAAPATVHEDECWAWGYVNATCGGGNGSLTRDRLCAALRCRSVLMVGDSLMGRLFLALSDELNPRVYPAKWYWFAGWWDYFLHPRTGAWMDFVAEGASIGKGCPALRWWSGLPSNSLQWDCGGNTFLPWPSSAPRRTKHPLAFKKPCLECVGAVTKL